MALSIVGSSRRKERHVPTCMNVSTHYGDLKWTVLYVARVKH